MIRPPGDDNPDVLLRHCSSIEHVANLHSVSPDSLREFAIETDVDTVLNHAVHDADESDTGTDDESGVQPDDTSKEPLP